MFSLPWPLPDIDIELAGIEGRFAFLPTSIELGLSVRVLGIGFNESIIWSFGPPPILATQAGGVLRLNMGTYAHARGEAYDVDGPETFTVEHVGGTAGSETVNVTALGVTQTYTGVSKIVVYDAGKGDDTVQIMSGVLADADINGGTGDDMLLILTSGNVVVYGGAGNDTITTGAGNDIIYGEGGDDQITSQSGNDEIYGGDGNDTITSSAGANFIYGDAGNDIIKGGQDTDVIDGGAGNDSIWGDAGYTDVNREPVLSVGAVDWLRGGSGDDVIYGGAGADWIQGEDGADTIYGEAGDDILFGDFGTVNRSSTNVDTGGNDTIYGGEGSDFIAGGAGADFLSGGSLGVVEEVVTGTANTLFGDNGFQAGSFFQTLTATLDGNDTLLTGTGSDRIFGGGGNDIITTTGGDNYIFGDGGQLSGTTPTGLYAVTDGADTITSSGGADIIFTGDGANTVRSGDGNDDVTGGSGSDWIDGGAGNDFLIGGLGDDTLIGGLGDDVLFGGRGTGVRTDYDDASDFSLPPDFAYIESLYPTGFVPPMLTPILATREISADGQDTLIGGAGNDHLFGGSGVDNLYGDGSQVAATGVVLESATDGEDYLDAGSGNDLVVYGGGGNDILRGGSGNDVLRGGSGIDQLYGESGNDLLYGQEGIDGNQAGQRLYGGAGNDLLFAFARENDPNQSILIGDQLFGGLDQDVLQGTLRRELLVGDEGDDDLFGDGGDDQLIGGQGNDFMVGGYGDDTLEGGDGNEVMFGGPATGSRNDFVLGTSDFVEPPQFSDTEALYPTGYNPPMITPALVMIEVLNDGKDTLDGGAGTDILIGGSDDDTLLGGTGSDYLSGGSGADELQGGAGDDVIRGGAGADVLNGEDGIDQLYGDDGNDILFGGAGNGSNQNGQRLFGGAGDDELFAYAPTSSNATENSLIGDQLFGEAGADNLYGNIRSEVLIGGDGNDYISGDIKAGPNYVANPFAATQGGADLIKGGRGEDQLFGGGGADEIWGGAGTDLIRGQAGLDIQYGGEGIDVFVLWLELGVVETMNGHYGNESAGDVADDNATDILSIDGTTGNDVILLSQTKTGPLQLRIDYYLLNQAPVVYRVNMLDAQGQLQVEQIQLAGLAGDDVIGFVTANTILPSGADNPVLQGLSNALDLTLLSGRSREFIGVFDGNSGNDILIGSAGRDRLDGGPGSDTLYGFADDDRLWGDGGGGSSQDHDILYAGQGNDDLIGGQGTNSLYAWSFNPALGGEFGVFVDTAGQFFNDSGDFTGATDAEGNPIGDGFLDANPALPARTLEVTGLNRMLGSFRDDSLYGGTVLDFMYGNGGNDSLYRANGTSFESMDGGEAGDAWKEYARESDQVWYVGGSNADDEITVDFVTEPGLLSDHHLITRLTNNNGNFSFSAQVRLDFSATDQNGDSVWGLNGLILDLNNLLSAGEGAETSQALDEIGLDPDAQALLEAQRINDLLPPEGDFLLILIDALKGNDTITIGPTVQKTVWIDAGPGDDVVTIRSGNAILVDKAESVVSANGLRGRNDIASNAYTLILPGDGLQADGLTLDNPEDHDWFKFTLTAALATSAFKVRTASPIDALSVKLFLTSDTVNPIASLSGNQTVTVANISSLGLTVGTTYLIEIKTDRTPTIYGIEFRLSGTDPELQDLSLRNDVVRRDVIIGGTGNDILMGGAGEDWIFGNEGNDVLSGGLDRNATDLLFGGPGDDTFQIFPDALPLLTNQPNTVFDPATGVYIPQASEQLFGGEGNDRVLFLGGDLDRRGLPVPDYVALRYNTVLHRYEFVSLVWDIGTQSFMVDGSSNLVRHYMFYQTKDIELTQISTRAGNDVVNETAAGSPFEDYGIELGDFEQGAHEAALIIEGGDGNDILFGGALNDILSGGNGNDLLVGGPGNDQLFGNGGNDQLYGHSPASYTFTGVPTFANPGFASERYAFDLAVPTLNLADGVGRSGVDLTVDPAAVEDNAYGLGAASSADPLTRLTKIGDFNGDHQDDFIVVGAAYSYILFGPVALTDLTSVGDYAEIVVDNNALGRPAERFGDVNGDGMADLAFIRQDGNDTLITVVFGNAGNIALGTGTQSWAANWNQTFVSTSLVVAGSNANARMIRLTGSPLSRVDGISVQMLNYTGDSTADILIIAHSSLRATHNAADAAGYVDIGYLFSGATVVASTTGTLTTTQALVRFRSNQPIDNLKTVVAGDINRDGLEDLQFGDRLVPITDHSATVVSLSSPTVTVPYFVGDLNRDGYSEFAYLTGNALSIVYGNRGDTNPDTVLTGAGIQSVSSGDFNGDGEMDLAVVRSADQGGGVHVFYSIETKYNNLALGFADADEVADFNSLHADGALNFSSVGTPDRAYIPTTAWDGLLNFTIGFDLGPNGQASIPTGLILQGWGYRDNTQSTFSLNVGVSGANYNLYYNPPNFFGASAFANITQYVTDGRSHHYTLNISGGSNAFYVDGVLIKNGSNVDVTPVNLTGGQLALGNYAEGYFTGSTRADYVLDNLTFWNKFLSAGEVANVALGNINPDDPSLNAWYQFNEPGGKALVDSSGHQADGFLGNVAGDPASQPTRITTGLTPSVAALDLNGDRVDDLAIAAGSKFTGDDSKVFALYGARQLIELPSQYEVLENTSVPGSGSFVVDRGAGFPELFDNAGRPFQAVGVDQWFQFTTLGDGQAGDSIYLAPSTSFDFRYFRFTPTAERGGVGADAVQLSEFRLFLNGNQVTGATATNPGGNNFSNDPAFAIDGNLDTKFYDANKGALVLDFGHTVSIDSYDFATGNDVSSRDPIRWKFEGSVDGVTWETVDDRTQVDQDLWVPTARKTYATAFGLISPVQKADLIDASGRVLATDQAAFDLRILEAGTYYLRAHKQGDLWSDRQSSFTILIQAPRAGERHEQDTLPDADTLYGGAGNDLIVGNYGLDRLFGEDGADTFTGELMEIRDRDALDRPDLAVATVELSFTTVLPPLDPIIDGFRNVLLEEAFNGSLSSARWNVGTSSGVVLQDLDNGSHYEYGTLVDNEDYAARLDGQDILESITLSLSGKTDVILTFSYMRTGPGESPDPGDNLNLSYWNGSAWVLLISLPGDGPDMTQFNQIRVTLPAAALISTFKFRFQNLGTATADDWYVDNVEIVAASSGTYGLRDVIALKLGISPTDNFYASDLASIVQLGASGLNLQDISSLRHLLNLRILTLAYNNLTDADLAALQPTTLTSGLQAGEPAGLYYLETLNLSGNSGISSLNFLEADDYTMANRLAGFKELYLEGTGIDPDATSTLNALAKMTGLEVLTLPLRGLQTSQDLALTEGEPIVLVSTINGNWSVKDALGNAVAFTGNGTNSISFTPANDGQYIVRGPAEFHGFEAGSLSSLPWVTTGSAWYVTNQVSSSGSYSMRSAAIPDFGSSSIEVTLDIPLAGNISFDKRISSEASYDFLRFYIDNVEQQAWSGVTTVFTTQAYAVSAGTHTFKWTYSKDVNTTGGLDAAFIDNISFPSTPFPVVVRNVAPSIIEVPGLGQANGGQGPNEGQGITLGTPTTNGNQITYPVLVGGVVVDYLVVQDPGLADLAELNVRVQVTDKSTGQSTDLIQTSLYNNSDSPYLESDFELTPAQVLSGITASFWFKALGTDEFGDYIFPFRLGNTYLALPTSGKWAISNVGYGTLDEDLDTGIAAQVGEWHHITLVAEAGQGIRFYQDGVEFSAAGVVLDLAHWTMALGLDRNSLVDDIRIWDRPLSAAEIQAERNSARPVDQTSLISYWDLNDGGGEVIHDSNGNGNTMRAVVYPTVTTRVWSLDTPPIFQQPLILPDNGDYRLDITVSDRDGGAVQNFSTFTVRNLPPTIVVSPSSPASQFWNVNQLVSLDASASTDPGLADALSYRWEVTTDNGQSIAGSVESQFSFTPLYTGNYDLTLTVTDKDGGTTTETHRYIVKPVAVITNHSAPTIQPGNLIQLDTAGSTPLAPQGALRDVVQSVSRSYTWSVSPTDGFLIGNLNSETLQFVPEFTGVYTFTLTLTDTFADGSLVSTAVQKQINVTAVNVVIAGPTTATEGAGLNFTAQGLPALPVVNPAVLNISRVFNWTATASNGQVIPGGASAGFSFVALNNGTYTVNLTVTDYIGGHTLPAYTAAAFTVTVANGAPVIEPVEDLAILLGEAVEVDFTFTDPGILDSLTYTLQWDDGLVENGAARLTPNDHGGLTGRITGSHVYTSEGDFTVVLIVSDGLNSDAIPFHVVVTDQTAPTALFTTTTPQVRTTPLTQVVVRFSETVQGVNAADFVLNRNGSPVAGISVSALNATDYQITLPAGAALDGDFVLSLVASGSGIRDNSVAQNALAGNISLGWKLDQTAPTAQLNGAPSGQTGTYVGVIEVLFDEGVNGVDISDFTLTRDGQPVSLGNLQLLQNDPNNLGCYTLDLTNVGTELTQPTVGQQSSQAPAGERVLMAKDGYYQLSFNGTNAGITDEAGNGFAGTLGASWTVGVRPSVDIINVTPDPRNTPVGVVSIQFSQAVTGVDISDFILTRNGQNVDLSALSVTAVSGSLYTIDLTSVTGVEGAYELKLNAAGSGITDMIGNPLLVSANDTWVTDQMDNQVVGRYLSYKGSYFDNGTVGSALATDKTALLPGEYADFENYSSYSRGINQIVIDVSALSGAPTLADFAFKVGNVVDTALWTTLAVSPLITVITGGGQGGSDRIVLTWADNVIQNQWVQVTVKASVRTGLAVSDVFYFGNAIGDSGNSATDAMVNATDEIGARLNPRSLLSPATITNRYDYNRDGRVNATDQIIARSSGTTLPNSLKLIGPALGLAGFDASQGVTTGTPAGMVGSVALASVFSTDSSTLSSGVTSWDVTSPDTADWELRLFKGLRPSSPTLELGAEALVPMLDGNPDYLAGQTPLNPSF